MGTDYIIARKLAEMAEKKSDVIFTPTMPFGNADHHMGFPGTVSIGDEALYLAMKNITGSLYKHGARRFVFLNGHGGNTVALTKVGAELNRMGAFAAILNWWLVAPALNPAWAGGHGDAQETSAVLAINKDGVDFDALKQYSFTGLSEKLPVDGLGTVKFNGVSVAVPRSVDKVTDLGWYGKGDPKSASAEMGNEMLEAVSNFVAEFVKEFEKAEMR